MKSLRPYQQSAVEAVMREWEACRSTLLVLPTGCGKTLTAAEILRLRREAGRILWLAHRRELNTQAIDAIQAHAGLRCELEMAESRANVTGLFNACDVVVASVQSMHAGRRTRFPDGTFSTIVVDEAHHATAKSYRDILEHFPDAKVLGLTATPDRGDAVGLGAIFESCAFRYDIRTAIREGYLCPITQKRIECADLDLSDIRTVAGDLNQGQLERALTVDSVLHQVASPLVAEAGDRQTIVFTASVDHAHALVDVLAGYTQRKAAAVDGTTPPELRRQRLEAFASGEVQFLLNCAVLTEGFDAPDTACIAIARPTKSRALYAQMIGRGTRLAPDKSDCLVLDFVGNSGKHKLVTPLDVLAGDPIPEDVRKAAERKTAEGMPSEEALAEAEREAIERAQREEQRRAREAKVKAEIAYRAQAVDPFRILDVEGGQAGPRATPAQVQYLRSMGVELRGTPSKREASQMLDKLADRKRRGLCSFKQARLLAKHGLPTELSFSQASAAIDAIVNNGWSAPDWLRAQYAEGNAA